MAIEIIPKKEKEESSYFGSRLYYFAMPLLVISLISSLAFYFFKVRTSQEIEEVRNLIEQKKTEEVRLLESEIERYGGKTKSFSSLIQDRKSSVPFFKAIEETLHPEVFLTDFQVNVNEDRVSASAVARDLIAFDQQSKILEKDENIKSFNIPGFDRRENRSVSFSMNITFNENIFK